MTTEAFPPIDITAQWGRLNDTLVTLVDYVPDDKLEWSPRDELWNFKGILLHTVMARDGWMGRVVKDGGPTPIVPAPARAKTEIQGELRRSWERVQRFLADLGKLAAECETFDGDAVTGHWVAFHLLEHDIHHRADILHYLALLGIEHPDVGTP